MNAVNADYQAFLAERTKVQSELERKRLVSRSLLASHPYAEAVNRQFDEYFANVAPEDREPPEKVGLFDEVPMPHDPRSRYDEACASTTHDEE